MILPPMDTRLPGFTLSPPEPTILADPITPDFIIPPYVTFDVTLLPNTNVLALWSPTNADVPFSLTPVAFSDGLIPPSLSDPASLTAALTSFHEQQIPSSPAGTPPSSSSSSHIPLILSLTDNPLASPYDDPADTAAFQAEEISTVTKGLIPFIGLAAATTGVLETGAVSAAAALIARLLVSGGPGAAVAASAIAASVVGSLSQVSKAQAASVDSTSPITGDPPNPGDPANPDDPGNSDNSSDFDGPGYDSIEDDSASPFDGPGYVDASANDVGGGNQQISPLELDLTGKGINLSALSPNSPYFDLKDDGFARKTGWIGSGTGLLCIDKNGGGQVNDITELFGQSGGFADGFAALRALDSNGDGVIDAKDAAFSQLRVWVNPEADGQAHPGELLTLVQLGITPISLTAVAANQNINGNTVRLTSTYRFPRCGEGEIVSPGGRERRTTTPRRRAS